MRAKHRAEDVVVAATPAPAPGDGGTADGEPSRPSAFRVGDRWHGYLCGTEELGTTLVVTGVSATRIDAKLDFLGVCQYGSPPEMVGTVAPDGQVVFRLASWMTREGPARGAVDFVGTVDAESQAYEGRVAGSGCAVLSTHDEPRLHVRGWSEQAGTIDRFRLVRESDAGAPALAPGVDVLDLVLDDFGCPPGGVHYRALRSIVEAEPSTGTARRILEQVVHHRFPSSAERGDECLDGPYGAARIFEGANGSFSAPDRHETIYLSNEGQCTTGNHCEKWGTMTLSLFEGPKLLAFGVIEGGSSIHGVVDADGDGRDEIVLTTGFSNCGESSESASIVRIGGEGVVVVADLGQVLSASEFLAGTFSEPKPAGVSEIDRSAIVHARRSRGSTAYALEWREGGCPGDAH